VVAWIVVESTPPRVIAVPANAVAAKSLARRTASYHIDLGRLDTGATKMGTKGSIRSGQLFDVASMDGTRCSVNPSDVRREGGCRVIHQLHGEVCPEPPRALESMAQSTAAGEQVDNPVPAN
jgi:hypothetical protein